MSEKTPMELFIACPGVSEVPLILCGVIFSMLLKPLIGQRADAFGDSSAI
jgi:hypothetical protein